MGMTEDDKRSCCLLEIQETEAKYTSLWPPPRSIGAQGKGPALRGLDSSTHGSGGQGGRLYSGPWPQQQSSW